MQVMSEEAMGEVWDATSGRPGTKTCPRCGEVLFDDMDVCYGCLYDFGRDPRAPLLGDTFADLEEPDGLSCETELESTRSLAGARLPSSRWDTLGIWVRGSEMDVILSVGETPLFVGRDESCDLVLHSNAVSRRHLVLAKVSSGLRVDDLGSTNPALFEGRQIRDSIIMKRGDTVSVCGVLLTFLG